MADSMSNSMTSITTTLQQVVQENGQPSLANPDLSASRDEARRIMQICNACRYCEGFCSMFPAMTQHRNFTDGTLDYLANLCHNCRGCYYACQYAEPHEFNVNVPKTFNELRAVTWQDNAWPGFMARAFYNNGLILSLLSALLIGVIFIAAAVLNDAESFFRAYPDGNFKAIIPHGVMVGVAGPAFLFALFALLMSGVQFWRSITSLAPTDRHKSKIPSVSPFAKGSALQSKQVVIEGSPPLLQTFCFVNVAQGEQGGFKALENGKAILKALKDALTLKNLGGGGHGCNDNNERFSMTRRYLHHATFYGFMLCFAATSTGTIYHYGFGWEAPHDYLSLPVLFGTVGGVLLCIGTAGMYWMKLKTEESLRSPVLWGMEAGFIILLFMTSLTGLLLLAFRETSAMGVLLAVHLGFVLTFFLTLPFSKMVHGLYRLLALVRYHYGKIC